MINGFFTSFKEVLEKEQARMIFLQWQGSTKSAGQKKVFIYAEQNCMYKSLSSTTDIYDRLYSMDSTLESLNGTYE